MNIQASVNLERFCVEKASNGTYRIVLPNGSTSGQLESVWELLNEIGEMVGLYTPDEYAALYALVNANG